MRVLNGPQGLNGQNVKAETFHDLSNLITLGHRTFVDIVNSYRIKLHCTLKDRRSRTLPDFAQNTTNKRNN